MRIAQIAPLIETVPPTRYGGTERVVSALTDELVQRGHEVTLFASGDSKTHATLVSVTHQALRAQYPDDYRMRVSYSQLHLGTAYDKQEDFDIIHDHNGLFGLPFAQLSKTPVVMTLHGVITDIGKCMYEAFRKPSLVSISESQRQPAPFLHYAATVYNGLDFASYPFGTHPGKYLLFVGRICPEKGLHTAIEIAQKTQLPLIIAAKYEPHINKEYFETIIKPQLSSQIRWVGEVDQAERNKLYAGALASLHTVSWDEPFGLTLIEAMACGTPVIAFRKGSIPEVIFDGKTGFVVDTIDEAIQSVYKLDTIQRMYCRDYVRQKFGIHSMVDAYERVYRQVLAQTFIRHERKDFMMDSWVGSKYAQLGFQKN